MRTTLMMALAINASRELRSHAEPDEGITSTPHLSISQPHSLHVHPPHQNSRPDLGRRMTGCWDWQRGQETRRKLNPHFPKRRRVSRTTQKSIHASSAMSAKATAIRAMINVNCTRPPTGFIPHVAVYQSWHIALLTLVFSFVNTGLFRLHTQI